MSNSKILLSIIIPVYNAEKFIHDCLNSLLNQDISAEEYEIICVNDGSTDTSLAILQEYAKNNPNVIVIDKPNEGVSQTRNKGLAASRGEYVWFIDSDDWIARNCLGLIQQQIKKYHPSIIQVHYDWIKAEWRVKQCKAALFNINNVVCSSPCQEELPFDGAWSSIISKELLDRYNLSFNESLHYGEDILFIRDLFDHIRIESSFDSNKIIHLKNEIFYYYRFHDESACRTSWTTNREKYTEALLRLARINKERMLDTTKPDWYREKYTNLYYNRMYNYMLYWLPAIDTNLHKILAQLKAEKLYPIKGISYRDLHLTASQAGTINQLKERIKFAFFKWHCIYPFYYTKMKKKILNTENKPKQ